MIGDWTTTSWRTYHQAFSVTILSWSGCKFGVSLNIGVRGTHENQSSKQIFECVGAIAYYGLYPNRTALTLGLGKVSSLLIIHLCTEGWQKKNLKNQPSDNCSLVQFNRAQFELANQNTRSAITKNKSSKSVMHPLFLFKRLLNNITVCHKFTNFANLKKLIERPEGGTNHINQPFLNRDPTFERLRIILPRARWTNKILLVNTSIQGEKL